MELNIKMEQYAYRPNDSDFKDIVKTSETWLDVLRKCGYHNLGNTKTVKKRI